MYRSNIWILAQFEAKNNEYLQKIKSESKVQILPFPKEVLVGLRSHAMDMYEEITAKDPMAKRVHESFWSFKQRVKQWSTTSEQVFLNDVQ